MPTITQLTYALSVQKHRHFGRAAQDCHVSQPSLSAQIQKMEEELNVIIFDRSKQPILVTDGGKKVLEIAKRVMAEHRRFFDVADDQKTPSGEFHLGVIPTLSPYVVPLFVESFSQSYPKVKLEVSEFQTHEIIRKLYDDELDGGLLVTPLHDDRIIERVLFYEPFYVFTSANHPFYKRKILKEADLDSESVWLLDEGHCFRDQVIHLCSPKNRNEVLKNVTFSSGNLETLVNLIRRGRGYTLLPYLATQNLTKQEMTHQLKEFSKPVPTREVSLVHSRSFLKERIIEALEEKIVESCPPELKSLKKSGIEVIEIKTANEN